ncbi:hypothetical protein BDD12DRAFT_927935, partial [Trichophaea hybrida]
LRPGYFIGFSVLTEFLNRVFWIPFIFHFVTGTFSARACRIEQNEHCILLTTSIISCVIVASISTPRFLLASFPLRSILSTVFGVLCLFLSILSHSHPQSRLHPSPQSIHSYRQPHRHHLPPSPPPHPPQRSGFPPPPVLSSPPLPLQISSLKPSLIKYQPPLSLTPPLFLASS